MERAQFRTGQRAQLGVGDSDEGDEDRRTSELLNTKYLVQLKGWSDVCQCANTANVPGVHQYITSLLIPPSKRSEHVHPARSSILDQTRHPGPNTLRIQSRLRDEEIMLNLDILDGRLKQLHLEPPEKRRGRQVQLCVCQTNRANQSSD